MSWQIISSIFCALTSKDHVIVWLHLAAQTPLATSSPVPLVFPLDHRETKLIGIHNIQIDKALVESDEMIR